MRFLRKTLRAASALAIFSAAVPTGGAFPAQAQQAPAAPANPAPDAKGTAQKPPLSFAEALAKAPFGNGLALMVETQTPQSGSAEAETKGFETLNDVIEAFHKSTHWFGGVLAIGPQTYTELETDFSKGNAFADMPPTQAFTLLLAGLDDRQKAALAGKTGLGINDLTTAMQKHLFTALLPEHEAEAQLRGAPEGAGYKSLGVLRDTPASVRLRIAQEVHLECEAVDPNYGTVEFAPLDRTQGPKTYDLGSLNHYNHLEKVNGIVIRRQVPNTLKRGDLDYGSPRLRAAISSSDLKTVGDLIARIAKQTGLEIYAAAAYEKKTLLWISGGPTAAPASDLLRALAFSVSGTYRQVGTAFVLTDDVMGVGTRRQMILDFEEECDAERQQAVDDAKKALQSSAALQSLKLDSFGDPLAMTPEQEKEPPPDPDYHDGIAEVAVPYEKLTQQQQDWVQRIEAQVKAHTEDYSPRSMPDFEKKVHIIKDASVQMVIDGLDGVVVTDFGARLSPLFEPEPKEIEPTPEDWKRYENLPKWTDAAKAYARRAVICKPHTTADVDISLSRIAALGFNQMWLVVFENGKARVPGTPFPLDPACDAKVDMLDYAIAEGKKKGITVCPVVNAFAWGKDAPKDLRLWTIRGEDSAQNAVRRARVNGLLPDHSAETYNPTPKIPMPSPLFSWI